jgi:ubiquinone/menaquinone biosynthesis C-methylase UbiE
MEPVCYQEMFLLEDEHFWYQTLHGLVLAVLERFWPMGRGGRLLDCGCGTGGMLKALRTARPDLRCLALDISPLALAGCRQKAGGAPLVMASADCTPIQDAACQVVLSLDVFCHRRVNDAAALAEIRRMLAPEGLAVLNLPAFAWLGGTHEAAVHNDKRYTRPQVAAMLGRAGLEALHWSYWNTLLLPAMAARRDRKSVV